MNEFLARPVVVVCDDVQFARMKVRAILKRDFQVHTACDGREALALCQELKPDVLLSDLHMPQMNGIELVRRVRADSELRHLPVILLTGDESEDALVEGLHGGADDYLRKPVRARELRARVAVAARLHCAHKLLEQANLRLRENQAQLVQSEKLASLGQIAAGVAHEINNPLGFIQSNLTTLQEYTTFVGRLLSGHLALAAALDADSLGAEADTLLQGVRRIEAEDDVAYVLGDLKGVIEESLDGVRRVEAVVKGLKSFCRLDEDEEASVDLNESIETTLLLLGSQIGPERRVVRRLAPLPLLRCLPREINQVFMNLLSNALQATSSTGEIRIETRASDDAITLQIKDDGVGIPPEDLPKVFDPFFTTRAVGSGTGLGLSIAYGIVKRHGGCLQVVSRVGEGTELTARLPFGGLTDLRETA